MRNDAKTSLLACLGCIHKTLFQWLQLGCSPAV
jgi:hypothetical protein